MKLEQKRILDLTYTFSGVLWYYTMLLGKHLGLSLNINKSEVHSTKEDIQKGLAYSRSVSYFDVDLSSSGTTGNPTTVYASPLHWVSEQAAQYQYFKENDYSFRDKMVLVRSYSPKKGEPIFRKDKLRNFIYISPFHLTEESLTTIIPLLQGRYFLRGYPSSLEILAKLLQNNTEYDMPVSIFTASETLAVNQRRLIEKEFNARIYDWYGTSEPSVLLFQTKKSYPKYITPNFHCKIKLIQEDNRKIIYGKANWDRLSNLGYYKTNDVAEVDKGGDIIKISGRKSDIITVGKISVPITNFLTAFYNISGILKFQIINNKCDVDFRFVLKINDCNETTAKINNAISSRLSEVDYTITLNKPLKKSSGGKTPFFVKTF